ncbi:hypothetical protein Pcinc_037868 [Petrolisthes cinctipes]|uniref:Uncharacterized protein n=1 Tax=Petrolisthes cinctipes TaxID=88211 RepID=A0AAE1EKK8_PETCI|nr:hypothetical protein Pcinc_037868 [Petrolisthes cinctipes]
MIYGSFSSTRVWVSDEVGPSLLPSLHLHLSPSVSLHHLLQYRAACPPPPATPVSPPQPPPASISSPAPNIPLHPASWWMKRVVVVGNVNCRWLRRRQEVEEVSVYTIGEDDWRLPGEDDEWMR